MKYILLLLSIALTACSSTGGPSEGVKPPSVNPKVTKYLKDKPQFDSMAEIKSFLGTAATYSGNSINLNGNRISGKNIKRSSNSQSESSIPLRWHVDDTVLRNGIIEDIPGGILIKASNTEWNSLTFLKIGEDAISTPKDKSPGTKIVNCKFYNTSKGDKSIQLNDADKSEISKTYITGGQTGIRLQESTSKNRNVTAKLVNNTFEKVTTAVNVSGYTTVTSTGNKFIDVKEKYNNGPNTKIKEN